jgi:hypothetical protein
MPCGINMDGGSFLRARNYEARNAGIFDSFHHLMERISCGLNVEGHLLQSLFGMFSSLLFLRRHRVAGSQFANLVLTRNVRLWLCCPLHAPIDMRFNRP